PAYSPRFAGFACRSPPRPLARPVGAACTVERVERLHLFVGELEGEDPGILLEPLGMGRFREHDDSALDAPAQEHLRGRTSGAPGDLDDLFVDEVAARSERAVRLERDPALRAGL